LPAAVVGDLRALLDLMKPGRAEELSLPAPTGLILVGPPGTGKTLVAKLIVPSQAQFLRGESERRFGERGGRVCQAAVGDLPKSEG
jgi:AAA+ superfamily predicted ATPase